jgi:DNA-binding HxlR family transcriptional regulator
MPKTSKLTLSADEIAEKASRDKNSPAPAIVTACPVERAIRVIGGNWVSP